MFPAKPLNPFRTHARQNRRCARLFEGAFERIAVGASSSVRTRIEAARMALYHFHLVNRDVKLDLRVVELVGESAILDCAERVAVELLEGSDRTFARDPDAWEIRVTDEAGAEVLALPLSEIAGRRSR